MKIAFFVHRFPMLSEAFIVNAAIGLTQAGCEVDIYAMDGPGEHTAKHATVLSDGHGWRAYTMRLCEQPRRRLALAPLAAAKLTAQHGLDAARAWDRRRFGDAGKNLVALHEASTFRRGGRYDILHCQFGTLSPNVLNHRDAGFLSGRVVVHFRGFDISGHIRAHGARAYDDVFARADGFITNCGFFRDRLLALGAPAERTSIVPSPVDPDRFPYVARTHAPGETLRLLCVGRLVEKKGFSYAIDAIGRLARDGVDVDCRIIGDGPLRQRLEAEVEAHGLSGKVRLTGAATHEVIAAALAEAHIFLAPSTTGPDGDQDASINTLKEAMAAGCPFVASEHGGIPEMVAGVDGGVTAPEADAGALHQALRALIARSRDWPAMGLAARAHIEQHYSFAAATARTLGAYALARAEPTTAAFCWEPRHA